MTKETDRLYLWILVLAVTYETFHIGVDLKPPVDGGRCEAAGFFGVLQRTLERSNTNYCKNTNDKADNKKSSGNVNGPDEAVGPNEAVVGAGCGAALEDGVSGGDRVDGVVGGEGGGATTAGALNKGETQIYTAEWAQKMPGAVSVSVAPHPAVTNGGDRIDSSRVRSDERGSVLV